MSSIFDRIMNEVRELPTLPTVYNALAEAVEQPVILIDKIADVISKDQATAFKILKVTNSPFYGFRGRIDTISKAIMFLGINEIKNIVFSFSVTKMFSGGNKVKGITQQDLWAHSIAVGIFTRVIGQAQGIKNVENYFLAGVIHDIGKLVLMEYAHVEYEKVIKTVKEKNCSISEAERDIMCIDHSQAGMLLAERWKLPESIARSIANHQVGTVDGKPDQLVGSVHLANFMARIFQMGFAGDDLVPTPNIDVWQTIPIPPKYFFNTSKKLFDDFDHTISVMLDKK